MIELPLEFLNVLFMLLIVFAASTGRGSGRLGQDAVASILETPGLTLDPSDPAGNQHAQILAFKRNLIGAARREGGKNGPLRSDSPRTGATDDQGAPAGL